MGVNVGFGKRLKWPDDYFTFTAELGYNWYYLKNWDYLFLDEQRHGQLSRPRLHSARNSIDNPIYTRSGSTFQLSFQMTPPAELFSGKRTGKIASENTEAASKELYRWIEYWKLRFKSRTYTPLSTSQQWTPVLMTRFDFGLTRQLQQVSPANHRLRRHSTSAATACRAAHTPTLPKQ